MKNYDVIVIGSGCGTIITDEAVAHSFKTALVDRGPLGPPQIDLDGRGL